MTDQEKETVLSIRIEEGFKFKSFIDAISSLIARATIEFNEYGMFIVAVSEGRIGYVEFNLSKQFFSDYTCSVTTELVEDEEGNEVEEEVPVRVDLNIEDLNKILSSCGRNDEITIEYAKVLLPDEETGENVLQPDNKIDIKLRGETESGRMRTRRFRLSLEALPDELRVGGVMRIDQLYIWNVLMDYNILKEVLADAEKVSDKLEMEIESEEGVNIYAGAILGDYDEVLEGEEIEITLLDGQEERTFDAVFPIEQLKSTIKMAEISEGEFNIQFGYRGEEPCPVRFKMNVLGVGSIQYFISPRGND